MLVEPRERVTKSSYDIEHDILYLFTGHPQFGYEEEIYPGIYLRRAEETDEVIGAIIMGYRRRLRGSRIVKGKIVYQKHDLTIREPI